MKNIHRLVGRLKRRGPAALRILLAAVLVMPDVSWVGVTSAQAATVTPPPTLMNFQGRLTDNLNNPLTGSENLFLEIYDASSGGNQLWSETQNGVTVSNGVFAVELGAVTPLTAPVLAGGTAYLQITVNGNALTPRERLITSPYAFSAHLLQGRDFTAFVSTDATAQTVGGVKTFNGEVVVPVPANPSDAATKSYVDTQVAGGSGWTRTAPVLAPTNATDNVVVQSTLTVQGGAFSVGGSTFVVVGSSVGVGTTAPTSLLSVMGTIDSSVDQGNNIIINTSYGAAFTTGIRGRSARGTMASPLATQAGDKLAFYSGTGYDGSSFPTGRAAEQSLAAENFTPTHHGALLTWLTTPIGGTVLTERMRLTDAGNLGVQTTVPQTALDVNGGVTIRSSATWVGSLAPAVPSSTQGTLYYDSGSKQFMVSQNGGAYAPLTTGGPEIAVSTIDATTTTPYGGVNVTSNVIVSGGLGVGMPNSTPDSIALAAPLGYSLTIGPIASGASLNWTNSRIQLNSSTDAAFQNLGTGGNFVFLNSTNSELLRLDNNGNIGIGAVNPAAKLHVSSGTLLVDGNASVPFQIGGSSFAVNSQGNVIMGPPGVGAQLGLSWFDPATDRWYFNLPGGGKNGGYIGTVTGAGNGLELGTVGSDPIFLGSSALGVEMDGKYIAGRSSGIDFMTNVSGIGTHVLKLIPAPGAAILATQSANVGLGTTSPANTLDVNGGAIFRSSSTWGGTSAPVLPPSTQGALYYDSGSKQFMASQNGGAFSPLTLGGAGNFVQKSGDTMTGPLTLAGSTLTVTGQDANGFSLALSSGASMPGGTLAVNIASAATSVLTPIVAPQPGDGNGVVVRANQSTIGTGGGVSISAGNSSAAGAPISGGAVSIAAGSYTGGTNTGSDFGGAVTITAGNSNSAAAGGTVTISGGNGNNPGGNPGGGVSFSGGSSSAGKPGASLSLSGGSWSPNAGGNAFLQAGSGGSPGTNGYVAFFTDGAERARLASDGGFLGLNTTTPATRLDVNGGATFRSSSTWVGISAPVVPSSAQGALYYDSGSVQFMVSQNGGAFVGLGTANSGGGWLRTAPVIAPTNASDNVVIQSTLTVQGDAFSVGTSTFAVSEASVAIGTAFPGASLDVVSVSTVAALVRNGANQVLRVDATNDQTYFFSPLGTPRIRIGSAGGDSAQITSNIPEFGASGGLLLASTNGTLLLGGGGGTTFTIADAGFPAGATIVSKPGGVVDIGGNPGGAGGPFGADLITFHTEPNAATQVVERMRIDKSGNVGVGTVSPVARIHMSSGTLLVDGNAQTPFQIGGSTLVVNSGYVGIGRSSPTQRLDVAGLGGGNQTVAKFGDTGGALFLIHNDPIVAGNVYFNSGFTYDGNGGASLVDFAGGLFSFQTAPAGVGGTAATMAEKMRLTNLGNLGIGTTAPATSLDVNGGETIRSSSTWVGISAPVVPPSTQGALYYDSGTKQFLVSQNGGAFSPLGTANAGGGWTRTAPVVALTNAGDSVGIGTANPAAKIHMSSGTLLIDGNSGTPFQIGGSTLVVNGGFVGMGTQTPQAQLHVEALASGTTVQMVQAASGQAADLTQWLSNGSSFPMSLVDRFGRFVYGNNQAIMGAGISALTSDPAQVGLAVRGLGGQTADLLDLQAAGAVPLFSFSAAGNLGVGTGNPTQKIHMSSGTLLVDGNSGTPFQIGGSTLVVSGGYVGVGTATPASMVEISGPGATLNPDLRITNTSAGGRSWRFGEQVGGNVAGTLSIYDATTGATRLLVNSLGYVGVGTSNPGSMISISGNGANVNTDLAITNTNAGGHAWRFGEEAQYNRAGTLTIDDATAGATRLLIDSFGDIGLSTGVPVTVLDVNGGETIRSSSTWVGTAAPVVPPSTQGALYYDSGSKQFMVSQNGGAFSSLGTANSGGGWTRTAPVVALANASDSVGVGTANPAAKIHMSSGTLLIDGSAQIPFQIGGSTLVVNSGSVGIGTATPGTALDIQTPDGTIRLKNTSGANPGVNLFNSSGLLKFSYGYSPAFDAGFIGYGGNAHLAINSIGNVGIGTTSPAAKIHMSSGTLLIDGSAQTPFQIGGSTLVVNSGYVGIGTTSPNNTFEVHGVSQVGFDNSGSGSTPFVVRQVGAGKLAMSIQRDTGGSPSNWQLDLPSANTNLGFAYNGGSDLLSIQSGGNVGVGTTGPGHALDVQGGDGYVNAKTGLCINGTCETTLGGAGTDVVTGTGQATGSSAFSISNNTTFTTVTGITTSVTLTNQTIVLVALTCGWVRTGGSYQAILSSQIDRDSGSEDIAIPSLGGLTNSSQTNVTLGTSGVHIFTGLASGSHTFTYQVKTNAFTDNWADTPAECQINAVPL